MFAVATYSKKQRPQDLVVFRHTNYGLGCPSRLEFTSVLFITRDKSPEKILLYVSSDTHA